VSVVTVIDVEQAAGVLHIGARDVVTPLARDRAKELGICIERSGAVGQSRELALQARKAAPASANIAYRTSGAGRLALPAAVVHGAPSAAPTASRSGALYRRNAYGKRGERALRTGAASEAAVDTRPRVAVIGAGHVGATTALQLAESNRFARLALLDVLPGLAAGLALDLWHAAALGGFTTRVEGADDAAVLAGADVVVITAGRPRTPGMSRSDLTAANTEIIRLIGSAIAAHAPSSVIVVVTNPLEEMTELVCQQTGFEPERVVGMGGLLDAARFRSLVGLAGFARPQDVRALVLGSHGAEMVIPLSQASANGVALEELIDAAALAAIVRRTRESGAEVTNLLRAGSAFLCPAACIAAQVHAIVAPTDDVIPACVRSRGAYGTVDTRVGLPVRLGRTGLREIVTLPLRPAELQELREAAKALAVRIKQLR
jgi:malate dehydrogenase